MRALPANIRAILWMLVLSACDAAILTTVRLMGGEVHPFMILAVCNALGLACTVVWMMKRKRLHAVRTKNMKFYILRGMMEAAATGMVFMALMQLPMSLTKALGYMTPVLVMAGAGLILKERLTRYRVAALASGLCGMLLVLRPDVGGIDAHAALMVLASCFLYSSCGLIIKRLTRTDAPDTILFYMFLFTGLVALVPALIIGDVAAVMPHAIPLLGLGFLFFLIQMAVTKAFALAPVNALMPYAFVSLILTSISGYVIFGETPRGSTFIGAAVILAGVCYAALREAQRSGLVKR